MRNQRRPDKKKWYEKEHKKQLVLEDFQQLDLEKLNVPHDSIREEVEAAQRTIVRSARVLLEDGQIQLAG